MNETLQYDLDSPAQMCVVLGVFEDGLVESNETLFLEIITEDPAVTLVEPRIAVVNLINTDGEKTIANVVPF